jgi:hypothetical protein
MFFGDGGSAMHIEVFCETLDIGNAHCTHRRVVPCHKDDSKGAVAL